VEAVAPRVLGVTTAHPRRFEAPRGAAGYQRQTTAAVSTGAYRISREVDTSTPYVIGKVVSRLEMDSRWALARSVRALVAERDALKERLDVGQCSISDVVPGPDIVFVALGAKRT
jgi:hypothetical protein